MRFEWDSDKAEENRKKHRVSFDEAVTVFYDPLSATFDGAESVSHAGKTVPAGTLWVEIGPNDSTVQVLFDLK